MGKARLSRISEINKAYCGKVQYSAGLLHSVWNQPSTNVKLRRRAARRGRKGGDIRCNDKRLPTRRKKKWRSVTQITDYPKNRLIFGDMALFSEFIGRETKQQVQFFIKKMCTDKNSFPLEYHHDFFFLLVSVNLCTISYRNHPLTHLTLLAHRNATQSCAGK